MSKDKDKKYSGQGEFSGDTGHKLVDDSFNPEIKKVTSGITLRKYLTDFSKNHKIDFVIEHWRAKTEPKNVVRSKNEWDKIIKDFFKQEAR